MPVRLFIAKLPLTASERDLREHFSQVGPVSSVILPTDRETGKKRGFAFVDFEDKATAEEAIRRFNNAVFSGQAISVSEARPREERAPGARVGAGPGGGYAGRNRFGGGLPTTPLGPIEEFGEERRSRRSQGVGKGPKNKKSFVPKAPGGPIREKRTGRVEFLDEGPDEDLDFDNVATSAPASSEDDLDG